MELVGCPVLGALGFKSFIVVFVTRIILLLLDPLVSEAGLLGRVALPVLCDQLIQAL